MMGNMGVFMGSFSDSKPQNEGFPFKKAKIVEKYDRIQCKTYQTVQDPRRVIFCRHPKKGTQHMLNRPIENSELITTKSSNSFLITK